MGAPRGQRRGVIPPPPNPRGVCGDRPDRSLRLAGRTQPPARRSPAWPGSARESPVLPAPGLPARLGQRELDPAAQPGPGEPPSGAQAATSRGARGGPRSGPAQIFGYGRGKCPWAACLLSQRVFLGIVAGHQPEKERELRRAGDNVSENNPGRLRAGGGDWRRRVCTALGCSGHGRGAPDCRPPAPEADHGPAGACAAPSGGQEAGLSGRRLGLTA